MTKPMLDLRPFTDRGATNRAHKALGPGHLRINAADDDGAAEVLLYGEVGGWWDGIRAEDLVKELAALDATTINLRINSPGGSVFEGVTIYNALAVHAAHVVVHVEALAASIASVIAMAGDEIRIGEAAQVMIHKPWSLAIGDAEAMRKEAEVLDTLEDGLLAIYAARTDRPVDELKPLVAAETWFRGQAAVDAGFADTVVPAKARKKEKAARSALLSLFKNTPSDLAPSAQDMPQVREFERLLREGDGRSNSDAKRLAALAARVFGAGRDAPPSLDDEGLTASQAAADAERIAAFIRSLISRTHSHG